LVDVKRTLCMIPFHFHAKEKMQVAKIFHFELSKKFFFHSQKLYWKQLENKQEMKASRFMKWNNCIN
jgi:hypothetical protein